MGSSYDMLAWEPLFTGNYENFSWMNSPSSSNAKWAYVVMNVGTSQNKSGYNGTGGARPALYE